MPHETKAELKVLIVGAGPVGLSLAIELGSRGIPVVVIEREVRGGAAPRAKTTNVRTRSLLRRWGLADRLAQASPFGIDFPNDMRFVTSLVGYPLATFEDAFNAAPTRNTAYPEHAQWIPQYTLERILREHAQTLPSVELCMGQTFKGAEQGADDVIVTIEDEAGTPYALRAEYLVGADGSRSVVRDAIGAKMVGRYALSRHYNIIFRAPGMADAHRQPPAVVYWQLGPRGFSAIGPMDVDDVWFFALGSVEEGVQLSDDQAAALIRDHTGIDLPYKILSKDYWAGSELMADRYRDRRIFLAGDACHLHPPFGGYGMNMGVGDAVDLGWKLAANIEGWGGETLLASYEAERRPVHRTVIDEALANYQIALQPNMFAAIEDNSDTGASIRQKVGAGIQASKGREFHTLGTVLGLCYEYSPVIVREAGPAPAHDNSNYVPSAYPGCLAPHAWLDDGRSLYDLFGSGLTLLASEDVPKVEIATAVTDAQNAGVPLEVVQPKGVPVTALYQSKMALIRPDQTVAWRGDVWINVFDRVLGRELDAVL
ncbi:FAD-dependent monooxygenase [Sphingomonas sp. SUN039]|uniref:FAD-dependent monooxygenase n=1 Tax=Sphingomonas sp. SUN039 TaxID=2937787 RepID=UPI002164270B|nr:FAD-dependent monooxygenase [Sphingomonas sp. SUN039]UVO53768.1 FAD-dependent monooxygenase [Sphingomonas sp. SUN039]